jgi:hypothetical protein
MNITLNTSLSFLSILRRTSFHIVVVCVKSQLVLERMRRIMKLYQSYFRTRFVIPSRFSTVLFTSSSSSSSSYVLKYF